MENILDIYQSDVIVFFLSGLYLLIPSHEPLNWSVYLIVIVLEDYIFIQLLKKIQGRICQIDAGFTDWRSDLFIYLLKLIQIYEPFIF